MLNEVHWLSLNSVTLTVKFENLLLHSNTSPVECVASLDSCFSCSTVQQRTLMWCDVAHCVLTPVGLIELNLRPAESLWHLISLLHEVKQFKPSSCTVIWCWEAEYCNNRWWFAISGNQHLNSKSWINSERCCRRESSLVDFKLNWMRSEWCRVLSSGITPAPRPALSLYSTFHLLCLLFSPVFRHLCWGAVWSLSSLSVPVMINCADTLLKWPDCRGMWMMFPFLEI